jgi:hypothetical protein
MILVATAPIAITYRVADSLITNDDGTVTVKLQSGKFLSVNPDGTLTESDNNGPYERAVQTPRGLVYWSTYQDPRTQQFAGGYLLALETQLPNASVAGAGVTVKTAPPKK